MRTICLTVGWEIDESWLKLLVKILLKIMRGMHRDLDTTTLLLLGE